MNQRNRTILWLAIRLKTTKAKIEKMRQSRKEAERKAGSSGKSRPRNDRAFVPTFPLAHVFNGESCGNFLGMYGLNRTKKKHG
jgi:hypothetical protein